MGARGPAKRPAHLKVISGTAPLNAPEEAPTVALDRVLSDVPPAPDWLPNEDARTEWTLLSANLIERGLLDAPRLTCLGMYCALSGKLKQKMRAGDMPAAHHFQQLKSLGKELGILGTATPDAAAGAKPAAASRLQSIKERSQRAD